MVRITIGEGVICQHFIVRYCPETADGARRRSSSPSRNKTEFTTDSGHGFLSALLPENELTLNRAERNAIIDDVDSAQPPCAAGQRVFNDDHVSARQPLQRRFRYSVMLAKYGITTLLFNSGLFSRLFIRTLRRNYPASALCNPAVRPAKRLLADAFPDIGSARVR